MAFTDEEILEEFIGAANRAAPDYSFDELNPDGFIFGTFAGEARFEALRRPEAKARYLKRLAADPARTYIRLVINREATRESARRRRAALYADPVKHAEHLARERAKAKANDRAKEKNKAYRGRLKADPVRYAAHLATVRRYQKSAEYKLRRKRYRSRVKPNP